MSTLHTETFDCLAQIGELAGILQDIAAREISESKPIAGTAIDMLARMIGEQVERGMNGPGAATTPQPDAERAPDQQAAVAVDNDTMRGIIRDLFGVADLAASLALAADGSSISGGAVDGLGDLARQAADRLKREMDDAVA